MVHLFMTRSESFPIRVPVSIPISYDECAMMTQVEEDSRRKK